MSGTGRAWRGNQPRQPLGLILAECVSGSRVVETDEPMKAAMRHALPEPLAFPRAVTESALFPVIERATAKTPDLRYRSAQEVEAARWGASTSTGSDIAPRPR